MKGIGFYGEDFLVIKTNESLIRENVIRILLTSPGERPMSSFGCRMKDYIFEQANVLQQEIVDEIRKSINRWEPRVNVLDVQIFEVEKNAVRLKLDLQIKETLDSLNLDTIIRI